MIEGLRLKGFRRYDDASVALGPGLNVIEGPNNAGKSTLFLAIEYALFGRVSGYTALAGLLRPKARGFGVELTLRGRDGARYLLQRAHVRPPRAKSKLDGHFTLKRLADGEEPERYLAASDFNDTEEDLGLKLGELTGLSRRVFDHVVHFRQGDIASILEGAPKLDVVLGVTAAVLAGEEMRALALEREKRAGALPVLRSSVERAEQERAALVATLAACGAEQTDAAARRAQCAAEAERAEEEHKSLAPALEALVTLERAEEGLDRAEAALDAASARRAAIAGDSAGDDMEPARAANASERREHAVHLDALTSAKAELDRRLGDLEGQLARREALGSGADARCETCGQPIDRAHVEEERRALALEIETARALQSENARARAEAAAERAALDAQDARLTELVRARQVTLARIADADAELERAGLARDAASRALEACARSTIERVRGALSSEALAALGELARGLHARLTASLGEAGASARERRAEARARMDAIDRELTRIDERRASAESSQRRIDRDHAELAAQLAEAQADARVAEQLRALSGGFKALQRSLRERACESLATETLRFHRLLSGRERELSALRIDPERYQVQVVPADIGREVPAHLFQGGGHRLLLGLAFRLALAKLVGPCPFLLLDEPTYGLDAEHRDALLPRLRELGVTEQLLLITHHGVEGEVERRIRVERDGHASVPAVEAAS